MHDGSTNRSREKGGGGRPAGRLVFLYAVFGAAWIAGTDLLLTLWFPDVADKLQTLKGWLFVAITSGLLYLLLDRSFRIRQRLLSKEEETRSRLERLIDNLPGLVYRCRLDEHWTIEFMAGRVESLTGYTPEDFLASRITYEEIIHPDDRDAVRTTVEEKVAAGEAFELTYRIRTRAGEERHVWERGCEVDTPSGDETGLLEGFITDVTERQRLQKAIIQSRKMESLGRMALGVAHDFNNILIGIDGFAHLLEAELPDDSEACHEYLEAICEARNRGADLTRQLLDFGRERSEEEMQRVNVNAVIRELAPLLEQLTKRRCDLELELADDLPPILSKISTVERILTNLVANARDAIVKEEKGLVRIETGVCRLNGDSMELHPEAKPGRHVRLSVRDTGSGMDEETQQKAFEPFFTTKKPGEGTGLGLATVHGLVHVQGGHVAVESEPGQGTTVHLYWPLQDEAMPAPVSDS